MSHATCQRCGKPGREERFNGHVRTLGICFVCGYGAAEHGRTLTRGERAEQKLNRAGYHSGDLFAQEQRAQRS